MTDPYVDATPEWHPPRQWHEPENFAINYILAQHRVVKPFEAFAREMAEQRNPIDPTGEILRRVLGR